MNFLPFYKQKPTIQPFHYIALSTFSQNALSPAPLSLHDFSISGWRSNFSNALKNNISRCFYSTIPKEAEVMKNLPIGIQSFEKIINENCLYVDKTDLIYRLISEGQRYFMSRPRRFGKSVLVSTLEAIFKGNKELFKNCSIYNKAYEWKKYPVISLDFTRTPARSSDELESMLKRALEQTAFSYDKSIKCPTLSEGLANLVMELAQLGPVVVLIDEYDKPLIDNLENIEVAEKNQRLLKDFYGTLKGLDKYLRFVFVTGVTKFSQVSLFSGPNNLDDITIDPAYATLLGYTDLELRKFMQDRIKQIAAERSLVTNTAEDQVLAEMKEWYNGYRFSWGALPVYNPHSTLNFLKKGRVQNYWYQTGTPTFLIDQIRKHPRSAVQLSGKVLAKENELLGTGNLRQIGLSSLMWQTGYLTIQNFDLATHLYELNFPNREVREAFFESIIQEFAELDVSMVNSLALECKQQLEQYQLTPFFQNIKALFATIPYSLSTKGLESFYHSVFIAILESMGIKTQSEKQTNLGRIDIAIEMKDCVYIMELKFEKDAETAVRQIENKKYKEQYSISKKDIILLGINFSDKARNISDWEGVIYRKNRKDENAFEEITETEI